MVAAIHKAVASVLVDRTAAQNMSGRRMLDQAEAAQLAGKVAEIVAREVAAGGLDVSAINQGPGPALTGAYQQAISRVYRPTIKRLRRSGK